MNKKLNVDHIARIEGHGNVHVEVQDGRVLGVEMAITEPARFFESMVKGREFRDIPFISSRICGICSPNHVVTSLKAIEDAFGIEVSERTRQLRQLLVYGSYLQNHATHLYVLAAPDYIGEASALPLATKAPEILEQALALKKLGNDLCATVGGRSIHPINAVVGGFSSEPEAERLVALADRLEAAATQAEATADLFRHFEVPGFETDGDMIAMTSETDYAVVDGVPKALDAGITFEARDYLSHLAEDVQPYTNAKLSSIRESGSAYMVGALARFNLSFQHLSSRARNIAAKSGLRPVCRNPFDNNLCQAVEILDACLYCADLCRRLAQGEGDSRPVDYEPRSGRGVACTEAPRGTVYHDFTFDGDGMCIAANIVTPTAQSLANLEMDIRKLAPMITDLPEDAFRLTIEKLIRAYDPCLSCSVH